MPDHSRIERFMKLALVVLEDVAHCELLEDTTTWQKAKRALAVLEDEDAQDRRMPVS